MSHITSNTHAEMVGRAIVIMQFYIFSSNTIKEVYVIYLGLTHKACTGTASTTADFGKYSRK